MANAKLFSTKGKSVKKADTVNKAGGRAYNLTDAEALCQYVVTSTFNDVYYATGKEQLDEVKRICDNVDPRILAKAAVYGRQNAKMKDVPAYLLAVLAAKGELDLLKKVWDRVINNPKMLLNFTQIVRSGVTGRKSFGTSIKKEIQRWITKKTGDKLFLASVGYSNPSLVDVIKMVHPNPANDEQNALFGYLLGKNYQPDMLPELVRSFEAFKADNTNPLPDMDYRALTNFNLTPDHWKQIAFNMPWNTLRLNLNTLQRNGVFTDKKVVDYVAAKLSNVEEIRKWNAFPYQIYTSYVYGKDLPNKVRNALQDALDHAVDNVPVLPGNVAVCVDVSGSMSYPITGYQAGGVASVIRCVDVAGLIASSIARTNPDTTVISFASSARVVKDFNAKDSIATNTAKLVSESRVVGHGTSISEAMKVVSNTGPYDFVVFVGDSQSWADSRPYGYGTSVATLWDSFKRKGNRKTKLAEIVLGPYATTQLPNSDKDIMNIGGFSDAVFDVLDNFARRDTNQRFLDVVESVDL